MDREKVIKGLEMCISPNECSPDDCPYYIRPNNESGLCWDRLMTDALAMLKEKDAVEPKHNPLSPTDWFCGKCGMCISRFHDYCPSCGQEVKWNENRSQTAETD